RISNTNRTIPAGIPTTQFTPDNNTLMLLHCDPANGDVTSSNLPLTWGSGATTTSYKFGSSGAYFNGVNSWIKGPDANAAYQLTGDFTYECFFQTTSTYATNCALIETGAASTVTRFCIALIGGQIRGDSNVAGAIFAACGNYIQGVFNHIAVSRTSSTMSVYLNGTRIYTGTVAQSFSVGNLRIGALYDGFSVFNGVMDCVRIINGTGIYSGATITVPTTALTAVTNTSLLLQFDVQDGALKDVSNSDVSLAATGLTITASNPPPVNTYSGAFNGSTSFVQGAYSAATQFAGPFTVEGFVRFNSVGSDAMIFENRASASGTPGFCVYLHSGNIIFNSGGNPRITGTSTPSINTWYHWAVSRDSSNNINMWFNGTWQGTTWNSSTLAYTDARLRLGVNCVDTALLNGNMSSIRINNSVAVYSGTSSITVPTARLTAITGTSLLINFDNLNPDSSTNNADLTWNCVTTRLSRFGNSALMLDGSTSGRVYSSSAPGISGNAAMGMDVWYYPITTGVSGYGIILGAAVSGGAILGHVNGAYTVSISRAFIVDTLVSTVPMVPNTWNHIEWDKTSAGGTSYLFLNGLAAGSAADNASYTSGALSISNSTAHTIISGLIDEPRISSTYRGHSSAFTPPTVEYGGTAATSSLQATAFTALTNPTTGALVARWKDDSGGAALNTDLIGEISVDGGSTWTAITLADQGPWNVVADSRVLYGKATLPGTGANIVSRLRTANGKAQKHRALSTFVS
ncbi:MAG: LamG-like jellyroll fold domain-containing protein, partial [Rhodospirillaceae bacterium]